LIFKYLFCVSIIVTRVRHAARHGSYVAYWLILCFTGHVDIVLIFKNKILHLSFKPQINQHMETQSYTNHRRYVKGFHFLLSLLLLAGLAGSIVNVVRHINFEGLLSCLLILLIFICLSLIFWFMRQFPIKAQDRAIRAEENLRYYILTGKPLSRDLSIGQITALRFAEDDEFAALIDKALTDNLSPDDIKKGIKNWRADHHRV
jgi:hypothetical protein